MKRVERRPHDQTDRTKYPSARIFPPLQKTRNPPAGGGRPRACDADHTPPEVSHTPRSSPEPRQGRPRRLSQIFGPARDPDPPGIPPRSLSGLPRSAAAARPAQTRDGPASAPTPRPSPLAPTPRSPAGAAGPHRLPQKRGFNFLLWSQALRQPLPQLPRRRAEHLAVGAAPVQHEGRHRRDAEGLGDVEWRAYLDYELRRRLSLPPDDVDAFDAPTALRAHEELYRLPQGSWLR